MEQFAIAGYSNGSLLCVADASTGEIWQTDYFGNKQQVVGRTLAAYAELEATTQQYYDKLVELGVIIPPKSPEVLMGEMQAAMADMSEIIKGLTAQVKELSGNGSQSDTDGAGEDVSGSKFAKRGAAGDK